jgi:hypothetical protein
MFALFSKCGRGWPLELALWLGLLGLARMIGGG